MNSNHELPNILVINQDPITRQLLGLICQSYSVEFAADADQCIARVQEKAPDLILIDAKANGQEVCRQIKADDTTNVPILCMSESTSPEDRFDAFAAGADDYINVPFDLLEFSRKVDRVLSTRKERQQLTEQVSDSYKMIHQLQENASQLQAISQFSRACLFCTNLQSLAELFIQVARKLSINCILRLYTKNGMSLTRSDSGEPTALEEEVLELGKNAARIYPFGKDRALFNWYGAQLLVRKVEDKSDIIAILMNSVEDGIRFLEKEQELMQSIDRVESEHHQLLHEFSSLFGNMREVLKDSFLSLGIRADLLKEDENALNEVVESFEHMFKKLVEENKQSVDELTDLFGNFRSDAASAANIQAEEPSDDIELF